MGVNARSLYRETRRRGVSRVAWVDRVAEGAWIHPKSYPPPLPSAEFQPRHDPSVPSVQTYKLGGGRVNTHNCIKLPGPRIIGGRALNERRSTPATLLGRPAPPIISNRVFLFSGHVDSWMKLADDSRGMVPRCVSS